MPFNIILLLWVGAYKRLSPSSVTSVILKYQYWVIITFHYRLSIWRAAYIRLAHFWAHDFALILSSGRDLILLPLIIDWPEIDARALCIVYSASKNILLIFDAFVYNRFGAYLLPCLCFPLSFPISQHMPRPISGFAHYYATTVCSKIFFRQHQDLPRSFKCFTLNMLLYIYVYITESWLLLLLHISSLTRSSRLISYHSFFLNIKYLICYRKVSGASYYFFISAKALMVSMRRFMHSACLCSCFLGVIFTNLNMQLLSEHRPW